MVNVWVKVPSDDLWGQVIMGFTVMEFNHSEFDLVLDDVLHSSETFLKRFKGRKRANRLSVAPSFGWDTVQP